MGCCMSSFLFLCLLIISLFFQSQFAYSSSSSSSLPSFNSSSSQLCSRDDYFALLQLNNSISNDPRISMSYNDPGIFMFYNGRRSCNYYNNCIRRRIYFWNESTDCCTWEGVTCDSMTGHVIGLDLEFNLALNTTLHSNSSLFLLRHLQQLNLTDNSIRGGSIPSQIGRLTGLTHLSLFSFVGQIPSELSYLSKLVSLDLSSNSLEIGKHQFESLVQNLTNLRELFLNYVNLSAVDPYSLKNLSSSLTSLHLSGCGIRGKLPENVFRLPNLLDLSSNSLEIGKQQFESLVQNLTDLRELILSGVNLSVVDPYSLKNLSSSLTSLHLSGCGIRGKLPENVFRLPNLHELVLSNNEELNYYFPRGNWSSPLKILDLSSTKSSGSLPASLGHLTLMTHLDLSYNNLTGLIPSSITNLTQLVSLDLSHNKLAGFVPSDITWPNPNLITLYLNDNELNGTLPSWFYHLPSLKTLKLNSNRLISHINEFRSQTLTGIDLHNNKLSGVFPPSICNITNFEWLDLSDNLFNGSIPPCLTTTLSVLNLGRNRFHGIIPPMFEPECSLQTFDVSENQLEGSIPRSLANCTDLEVLNLSKNNITDTFPFWLGILSELQVLVLKSNRFHGPILRQSPKNISAFSKLNIIDLSYNNFNGEIPSEFFERMNSMTAVTDSESGRTYIGTYYYSDSVTMVIKKEEMKLERILTIFKAVDISNNHFEGEIPKSVGNLKSLVVLNFSGNGFTGPIPSSFGNLNELESLDLSKNKLSGEIPTQLTGLTFLSHFDVSQNDLVGTIPRGRQFETYSNTSYEKNSGLCGPPLSKKCGNTEEPPLPPSTSKDNQRSYKFESTVYDWIIVVMGYVSGLVIGLVGGTFIFDKKKTWFMKILGMGRPQREEDE